MTNVYERALMVIGGVFTAFCLVSVLLGELTALWLGRAVLVGILIAGGAYGATWTHARIQNISRENELILKRKQAELKKMEAEATRAARESEVVVHRLHGPGMMLAVDHTGETPMISNYGYHPPPPSRRQNQIIEYPEIEQASLTPNLLETVLDLDCLFVWGGRRTGKTNFVQWVAADKIARGEQLVIIDPKPVKPGKWPKEARVVGSGHKYDEIEQVTQFYLDEIETRKEVFPAILDKITIIVDELFLLNLQMDNFMKTVLPAFLEGGEYNIHLSIISQSKTAKSTGLEGMYDLLDGFDCIINTKRKGPKHDPRSYYAFIDMGEGDERQQPPGKFIPGRSDSGCLNEASCRGVSGVNPYDLRQDTPRQGRDTETRQHIKTGIPFNPDGGKYVYEPPEPKRFYEDADHKKMVDLYLAGETFNGICRAVWGSANGRRIKQIKEILKQYGLMDK